MLEWLRNIAPISFQISIEMIKCSSTKSPIKYVYNSLNKNSAVATSHNMSDFFHYRPLGCANHAVADFEGPSNFTRRHSRYVVGQLLPWARGNGAGMQAAIRNENELRNNSKRSKHHFKLSKITTVSE